LKIDLSTVAGFLDLSFGGCVFFVFVNAVKRQVMFRWFRQQAIRPPSFHKVVQNYSVLQEIIIHQYH
jgi:hypothetical protein